MFMRIKLAYFIEKNNVINEIFDLRTSSYRSNTQGRW